MVNNSKGLSVNGIEVDGYITLPNPKVFKDNH